MNNSNVIPAKLRAILFDVDGTLVDTPDITAEMNRALPIALEINGAIRR